jgi:pSer/pThr/pTyr-binding forkhead associated (FHA) protein
LNESTNNPASGSGEEIESTRKFAEDLIETEQDSLSDEEQAAVDALPAGNALLIVRRGPNKGARFLLDSDLVTVGRHPNADIFLDDVTVSRRHAEISRSNSVFTVKDLASLNGTYLESARVEAAVLTNSAELQVGKYHFTFYASKKDS